MARTILVARIESPLGPLVAGATRDGVCMLEFSSRKRLEAQLAALRRRFHVTVAPGRNAHLEKLARQLAEYFAGRRRRFSVRLIVPGSPFQSRVWKELARIPYGETRTYGDLARRLGAPSASRAVGHANGSNPISIVLPCHRLVGKDGSLTGYGGGLWRKKKLLDLERCRAPTRRPGVARPPAARASSLGYRETSRAAKSPSPNLSPAPGGEE